MRGRSARRSCRETKNKNKKLRVTKNKDNKKLLMKAVNKKIKER